MIIKSNSARFLPHGSHLLNMLSGMFGLCECGTLRYDYDKKKNTPLTVLSTQLWIFLGCNVIGGCYMRGLTWVQCNMY